MKMTEIKKKAQAMGIKISRTMTKTEIVQTIQQTEGNTPCFGTGIVACPYSDCCFWGDCQS